jgi:hypothetical protein
MDFMPWRQFHNIVEEFQGNKNIQSLTCADYFRIMAFAQLTYRDSLRDTVTCLKAVPSKWYHLGIRSGISLNNLSNAGKKRDWRIFERVAHVLIQQAQSLYKNDPIDIQGVTAAVFALDSTTIDLCLSLFPWADFRKTKAAVKLHTLIDIRGNIPCFVHISKGKVHDVKVLDTMQFLALAFYTMDRGYFDFRRLYRIHQASAFFVTRSKKTRGLYVGIPNRLIKHQESGAIKWSFHKASCPESIIPNRSVESRFTMRKKRNVLSS